MKFSTKFLAFSLFAVIGLVGLQGCVVAPPQPGYGYTQPAIPPVGVAYVAPAYPVPDLGFAWAYHPNYGWGYFHRDRGWHRGWH